MTWPTALAARIETASEHPPLGWYSAALDRKQPAITVVLEARAEARTSLDIEIQVELSSP
jgi:hypothetical protein